MYRYLALTWLREDAAAVRDRPHLLPAPDRLSRRGWSRAFVSDAGAARHVEVWQTGTGRSDHRAVPIDGGRGAIVGRIFPKREGGGVAGAEGPAPVRAPATGITPASLGRDFWGQFVALLIDGEDLHVVRDAGGALPCHYVEQGPATIFFSDLSDVREFCGRRFSVNEDFLVSFATTPRYAKRITGLHGVGEVLPAEHLALRRSGSTTRFTWNPWQFVGEPCLDLAEARSSVRTAVLSSVGRLVGSHRRILHSLGGLDSSIVLASLSEVAPSLALATVNGYASAAGSDERGYARCASDHAGARMYEAYLDASRVDLERVFAWKGQPAPIAFFDCTGPAGGLYDLAERIDAESMWNGVGGDSVFYQIPHVVAALDGRGLLPDLRARLGFALDAARYCSASLAGVLGNMVRDRFRSSQAIDYVDALFVPTPRLPFLSADVLRAGAATMYLHPMLEAGDGRSKAKLYHVLATCFRPPAFYDPWQSLPEHAGRGDGIEGVTPLLSQPVIEACLRVPTSLLIRGGMDRSLARSAFADLLASPNLRRMSKSNPDALYKDVVARHHALIRETLIDGTLARKGILDRRALEREFNPGDGGMTRVAALAALDLFNWEAWTRSWE